MPTEIQIAIRGMAGLGLMGMTPPKAVGGPGTR